MIEKEKKMVTRLCVTPRRRYDEGRNSILLYSGECPEDYQVEVYNGNLGQVCAPDIYYNIAAGAYNFLTGASHDSTTANGTQVSSSFTQTDSTGRTTTTLTIKPSVGNITETVVGDSIKTTTTTSQSIGGVTIEAEVTRVEKKDD